MAPGFSPSALRHPYNGFLDAPHLQKNARRTEKKASRKVKAADLWYLYLLRCGDGSLYTGVTNNLERRLKMHQAGKASRYTRTHSPVAMVYSETCGDRSSALIRECEVKEWPRTKKELLVAGIKIVPKVKKPVKKEKR